MVPVKPLFDGNVITVGSILSQNSNAKLLEKI